MSRNGRRIGLVLAVGLALGACATQGRVHDREASEAFRLGATTPDEALAILGRPTWTCAVLTAAGC